MTDKVFALTWKHIDDRYLDHCIATWLLTHRGARHIDQYLTCEGRVVDTHVKLQTLVLCLTAYKVRVSLGSLCHFVEARTLFQFYINHTAVDTLAFRNGHRKSILNASLGTYTYTVTHTHTRTEISIRQSFRSEALHQCTNDTV